MSDTLIKVEGVSKKFCRSLKRSLWYGMQDMGNELLGRRHGGNGELRPDEFWALKDVSFELKRGECLGLIGHNGAGKTTLLRMLNGLIKPDQGRIEMRGRVGALIALGTGFNPILTGRENIYVNASVLGLSKHEINEKVEEIIDFAEIGDFIDSPVQSYSSGMQVRLGFAVATALKPDILLLDEILAVGDAGFRAKCYEQIYEKLKNAAVIFVSHDMVQVNRISNKVLFLGKGECMAFTNPGDGIERYHEKVVNKNSGSEMLYSNGLVLLENLVLGDVIQRDVCFVSGGTFSLSFDLRFIQPQKSFSIILSLLSVDHAPIVYAKKQCTGFERFAIANFRIFCERFPLAPGRYSVAIAVLDEESVNQIVWHYNVAPFTVLGENDHIGVPVKLLVDWHANGIPKS